MANSVDFQGKFNTYYKPPQGPDKNVDAYSHYLQRFDNSVVETYGSMTYACHQSDINEIAKQVSDALKSQKVFYEDYDKLYQTNSENMHRFMDTGERASREFILQQCQQLVCETGLSFERIEKFAKYNGYSVLVDKEKKIELIAVDQYGFSYEIVNNFQYMMKV